MDLFHTSPNISFNSFLCLAHHAITIPERNQEATLYLQELTSALPIQKLSQARLTGNTSPDYQMIPLPLSIYN